MPSTEHIIDVTIEEIAKIIETAGRGLIRTNKDGGEAQIGTARAIRRKSKDIRLNVLERLEG